MRLRNVPGSRETIAENEYVIKEDIMREKREHWHEVFGNKNPLYLEVGMGKGRFISDLALMHPENNYIGIEKYSSVLIRALEKRAVLANEHQVSNLYFLRMDAEDLPEVFGKGEVAGIYLNFSDPWPKDRHAKRRLPSRQFLARYRQILTPEGRIEFKTDNQDLFTFALEEAAASGWQIIASTRDLHHDPVLNEGNIMTEYEEKFSSAGNPICKVILAQPAE